MSKLEADYKPGLIKRIEERFPGCWVLRIDTEFLPGVPDLLILHKTMWALLEVKREANARKRPNQDHYVDLFDNLSFASFIYPENEEEVLNDLQVAFSPGRPARFFERQ